MLKHLLTHYPSIRDWLNANQGLESLAIFALSLLIGWATGVFASLRRKPKFDFGIIPGPTFACTFPTENKHQGHDVYRTAFALYLNVSNIGNAPSSLKEVHIGYHWELGGYSLKSLKYIFGWFWLLHQTIALEDFQYKIGEDVKIFPFLTQRSKLSMTSVDTYLEIGKSANGVVYFEQEDSWGACRPRVINEKTLVAVALKDVFGRTYKKKFWIPVLPLQEARKYNPAFGSSLFSLRKQREEVQQPEV